MTIIKFFLSFLFVLTFSAQAQEIRVCRSPYALASPNFNYGAYSSKTNGIGDYTFVFLWNTFGNKLENVSKELAKQQVKGVEIALFNNTCVRNKKCGSYETLAGYTIDSLNRAIRANDPKLINKLKAEANRASSYILARLRPDQTCYLNPFLEHNMGRTEYQTAVNWFKDSFQGRCQIVWNPVGGNPGNSQPPAGVSEGHGDNPKFVGACIANPDGTEIDPSVYPGYLRKYGSQCSFACTWGSNDNCRSVSDKDFTDPRKRTCKETKDFGIAQSAIIKARNLKPIPPWSVEDNLSTKGCKVFLGADGAKKDFLWKQSTPECCGRGAVTFLPTKYNKQNFRTSDVQIFKRDKKIGTAYEAGKYTEDKSGRHFFRFRTKAYDFPPNITVHYGSGICAKLTDPSLRVD